MKNVLVVQTVYRTMDPRCQMATEMLTATGWTVGKIAGEPCSSWAKNVALSMALRSQDDRDVLVHIDDDMVFTNADVAELVSGCLEHGGPVSGCYSDQDGKLVGKKQNDGTWLSGMGFFAVPFYKIRELAEVSRWVSKGGERICVFTWAGPSGNLGEAWLSSDYRLSQRLGGIKMLPIIVGHLKPVVLRPTTQAVKEWLT